MRSAFAAELCRLAERDERVRLLTGDLGFTVLDDFAARFPDRFVNVGVAEQNMVGIATGLAEAGYIPFVYSIATFASMRPYEFIRNGPVLHELPVRIVGVGAGFDYGLNGISHFALEDVAIMRAQPGLTVAAPADPAQAAAAIEATWNLPGPVYLRLGKQGEEISGLGGRFELGRSDVLREGADLALIALGGIAGETLAASETLAAQGLEASVAIVSSLTDGIDEPLVALLERVPLALTVEEGYVNGGLGSSVAELVAERGLACRIIRCGATAAPRGAIGGRPFLNEIAGISAAKLTEAALRAAPVAG